MGLALRLASVALCLSFSAVALCLSFSAGAAPAAPPGPAAIPPLVIKACQATKELYQRCVDVMSADAGSKTADARGLAKIAVSAAATEVAAAMNLLKQLPSQPIAFDMYTELYDCTDDYSQVSENLSSADMALDKPAAASPAAQQILESSREAVTSCQDELRSSDDAPSYGGLIGKGNSVIDLCTIAMAIIKLYHL